MKTVFNLTLALFILFPIVSTAQSIDDQVSQIRKWYKEIEGKLNNCDEYKVEEFVDEENYGEDYTELTAYFDKETNQFIKLVEYSAGEWHEEWNSYYFNNGVLFFIYTTGYYGGEFYTAEELEMDEEEYWQMGPEPKNLDAYEGRKYFTNNICISYLTKNKIVSVDGPRDLNDVKNEDGDISEISYDIFVGRAAKMLGAVKKTMKGGK